MNPLALALVLVSTVMHAAWNLLARNNRDEAGFFIRMLFVSSAVGLVPAVISEWQVGSLPAVAWWYVAGAGASCGVYYLFLGLGYRAGDFTTIYPVARSLPVLLVAVFDLLRGRAPTPFGWLGMALVVCGCLLAPLRRMRDLHVRQYLNWAGLWMILTAFGTVGYTLFDKLAAEVVQPGPATAARYGYFFFLFSFLTYLPLYRLGGLRKPDAPAHRWCTVCMAAAGNFGAYWLILWAYQLTDKASYVVAFRQFSIVFGVVVAYTLYRNERWPVRLAATALITAGLVVIGLTG